MINYLSLFSGIGAFEAALRNLEIPFNLVGFSEIDKYAIDTYLYLNDVNKSKNLGDITKINTNDISQVIDLITYGFPCQDISNAGKKKGFVHNGEITRSGLFFDALRLIEDLKPKVAIAENVKNLVGKRFKDEFKTVLDSLNETGYNNYWAILNSKDYGVPQHRERVFIISIRKDCDTGTFSFPKKFPLRMCLNDLLESSVDDIYYLDDKQKKSILSWKAHQKPFERVLGINSICPTLTARGAGENHSGMVILCENFKDTKNINDDVNEVLNNDIRKLTPRECFKLMGFKDEEFDKIKGISNTQLYKQAGNSIVVDVAEEMLCMLFDSEGNLML